MKKLIVPTIVALTAAAAFASDPAETPETQKVAVNGDPNQTICVREKEIGSRVSARRVCRTRAEWAAHQQQTRQVIERVQFNKQTSGN